MMPTSPPAASIADIAARNLMFWPLESAVERAKMRHSGSRWPSKRLQGMSRHSPSAARSRRPGS